MKDVNKTKRSPIKWEKIFTNDTYDKGLISKIYQELIHSKSKRSNLKMCRRPEQTFLQMWHKDCHEKMFNTMNPQGNANKKHNEKSPYTCYNYQTNNNNQGWQGCGEKETLMHHWWECKFVWSIYKTVLRILKN